jgi:hypothetical protein
MMNPLDTGVRHGSLYQALEVFAKPSDIRQKTEVFVILFPSTFFLAQLLL